MTVLEYCLASDDRLELPAGLDRATVLHNLELRRSEGKIRSFKVEGVSDGGEAETALLYSLWAYSGQQSHGREIRLIAPIGRGHGRPELGQVILRYDARGHATARLVGRGKVKRDHGTTVAGLTRSLIRDYALEAVRGDWRREELSDVRLAFDRIPAEDRGALVGTTLRRVVEIPDRDHSPEAQFFYQQSLQDTEIDDRLELRVADLAFARSETSFVGDAGSVAPTGIQTILHEVGHAVETEAVRAARHRVCLAIAAGNQVVGDWNRFTRFYARTYNALVDRERSLVDQRNARAKRYNEIVERLRSSSAGQSRLTRKLDKEQSRITTLEKQVETLASSRKALERLHDSLSAFVRDVGQSQHAQDTLSEYRSRPDCDAAVLDRARRVEASRVLDARQDRTGKERQLAAVLSDERSHRLHNFVRHVERHRIPAGITAYARDNWPAKPGELFAEAYALWLTDPRFLEENVPRLHGWFHSGRYRQDQR